MQILPMTPNKEKVGHGSSFPSPAPIEVLAHPPWRARTWWIKQRMWGESRNSFRLLKAFWHYIYRRQWNFSAFFPQGPPATTATQKERDTGCYEVPAICPLLKLFTMMSLYFCRSSIISMENLKDASRVFLCLMQSRRHCPQDILFFCSPSFGT